MIIAGLGNPGARYQNTRHNIGFQVVDRIAFDHSQAPFREKFHSQLGAVELPSPSGMKKVWLLKPQTFMNLSGDALQPAAAYFKMPLDEILVIHDELDLPLGRLQLKRGGGSGGHNGLKSIASRLGGAEFLRLRVGIGRPPSDFRGTPADFVLQAFAPSEGPQVDDLVARAGEAVELLVKEGLSTAMNHTNRRQT